MKRRELRNLILFHCFVFSLICGLWAAAQPMLRNNESKLNTKPKGRNEWNGTASRGRKLCFSLRAAVKWSEMEQRGPEASTQPSLHSIKIKLSILFFFHSVKLALLKGIKIYYNSKLIEQLADNIKTKFIWFLWRKQVVKLTRPPIQQFNFDLISAL